MDLIEAINCRHAVRSYIDTPIPADVQELLQVKIQECNILGDLNFRLVIDEPNAFAGFHSYGSFKGVRNYVILAGTSSENLQENVGYFGEMLALYAQTLGLNTCWVAMTYKKTRGAFDYDNGEKILCVLTIGYGVDQGVPHKMKRPTDISESYKTAPDWFKRGIDMVLLAPSGMNQQKSRFELENRNVPRETLEKRFNIDKPKVIASRKFSFIGYTKVDLGIAKYHFELGAGKDNFEWI